MNGTPDIFDVLRDLLAEQRVDVLRAKIPAALDAAVAFGIWQEKGGQYTAITRERIESVYFDKTRSIWARNL